MTTKVSVFPNNHVVKVTQTNGDNKNETVFGPEAGQVDFYASTGTVISIEEVEEVQAPTEEVTAEEAAAEKDTPADDEADTENDA